MSIILKYTGDGSFLPGVPDRDLSEEDIAASGMTVKELIKTGLYTETKMEQPTPSNKAVTGKYSNKEK